MQALSHLLSPRVPARAPRARPAPARRPPADPLLALTRAWCRARGFHAAAARLRAAAPDPLPPLDHQALLRVLDLDATADDGAVLAALATRADAAGPLQAAADAITEALYP